MNKKQARKARQQRNKQREQNERRAIREQAKKKARADFKVKLISDERKDRIAQKFVRGKAVGAEAKTATTVTLTIDAAPESVVCLVCDKKITKKDMKAKKFVALAPSTDKSKEYFAHSVHFFEEDGVTETADNGVNFQKMFGLIMKKELKDLLVD